MRFRTATLAAIAVAALSSSPAHAQGINLPPDVYNVISELYQASAFRCQAGFQDACQFYQMGVQEVATIYQQYQANLAADGFPRTPQQHQQIMQQNQQAFDTYQQGYQAQQQSNDAAHQRFIQSIWD